MSKRLMLYSFAQADTIRDCRACKARFAIELRIPDFWWAPWCKRLNGYFGSETTVGQDGKPDGCSMSPHSAATPKLIKSNRYLVPLSHEDDLQEG